MKICVCIKQVIDPEAPRSTFKIDPEKKMAIPPPGTPPVISPYDENALEAALKLKDMDPTVHITALSLGTPTLSRAVMKKALAVGADDLVLLEDEAFEHHFDATFTAHLLAKAIQKLGHFDLILCGRQSSDTDSGQVGLLLAELLKRPCVASVHQLSIVADTFIKIERMVTDYIEELTVKTPAVLTVESNIGELRMASLKNIMSASKKPVTVWKKQDLNLSTSEISHLKSKLKLLKVWIPERHRLCEIIKAETEEEAGAELAVKLKQAKVI